MAAENKCDENTISITRHRDVGCDGEQRRPTLKQEAPELEKQRSKVSEIISSVLQKFSVHMFSVHLILLY